MVYGLITIFFEGCKLGSSPSGATKKQIKKIYIFF
jgi:hypothetical protein